MAFRIDQISVMAWRALVLVLLFVTVCHTRDRHNSKMLQWEDHEEGPQGRIFPDSYEVVEDRDDRKMIIINNKAYDLSEEEQSRMWDLYLKKGYIPETDGHTDLNVPVAAEADDSDLNNDYSRQQPAVDNYLRRQGIGVAGSNRQPVKASRFVADPEKQHLIQTVNSEEVDQMKADATSTTESIVADRVATESPVDSSTVHYEFTQVSILSYIWREVLNLGDLLGREVVDSMSGTLRYLWRSVVEFVKSRGRRAVSGSAAEL